MNRYPLRLPRPLIRRIIDRKAIFLILPRRFALGRLEIHDLNTVRQNNQARDRGRIDLQAEELALTIEVDSIEVRGLLDLDFPTIRRAGFQTTEDFYLEWLRGRRRIKVDGEVAVHAFHPVDNVRFLHARVHRGYTTSSFHAAFGEPEALSERDLELLARRRRTQDEAFVQRAKRSITLRARDAARTGDLAAWQRLGAELAAIVQSDPCVDPPRLLAGTAAAR